MTLRSLAHHARAALTICAAFVVVPVIAAPVSVTELMQHALVHNADLAAARARAEAADARIAPAAALEDPMLEVGIINAPLPFSLRREEMTMEMLGLTQRLPYPGKRRLRREVATGDAQASRATADDLRDQILRQIRVAYEELAAIAAEERIVFDMRAALEEYITVAETRYATGSGTQSDVLAVQSQLGELQRRLLELEQKRAEMSAELVHLAGHERNESMTVTGQSLAAAAAPLAAFIESADARPRAVAVEAERTRAEHQLALMRREFYPDVDVKLSYGRREDDPMGMARDDMVSLTFGVNLPIWRRQRLNPQVAEARAMLSEREQMLRAVNHETRSMLTQRHATAQQARRSVELFDSVLIPAAEAAVQSTAASYRVGKTEFPMLIEARMRLYEAHMARVEAVARHNSALADLDYLAGRQPAGLENTP